MSCDLGSFVLPRRFVHAGASTTITSDRRVRDVSVLYLDGAMRAPSSGELGHSVRQLLRDGERTIIVDLAHVPAIDAAGVGELVRAYNLTRASRGVLVIANAGGPVRVMLERAGLLGVLSRSSERLRPAWLRRSRAS